MKTLAAVAGRSLGSATELARVKGKPAAADSLGGAQRKIDCAPGGRCGALKRARSGGIKQG